MLSAAERAFIAHHLSEDVAALMLQQSKWPNLDVAKLAQQIKARQKAKTKLPDWAGNQELVFPANLSVEQSSSEITAAYKAGLVPGKTLVDVTGGFGVDTFAFAHKFECVIYVERQKELTEMVAFNLSQLGVRNVEIHNAEAQDFLQTLSSPVDVVYLDPARRGESQERVHLLQDCEPDVMALMPLLFEKSKNVLLKTAPMLDIDLALQELEQVVHVWVVAVQNECKEVLYLLAPGASGPPTITAVNLRNGQPTQEISFSKEEEENAPVSFAEPQRFLYEPNTALLKAGGFKWLSHHFNLHKLHRNSHLYTSEQLIKTFPGRIFEIKAQPKANAKDLQKLVQNKKANITVRNYPFTVAQVREKLKLKEGGEDYLFATTDLHNKPILLLCQKVKM